MPQTPENNASIVVRHPVFAGLDLVIAEKKRIGIESGLRTLDLPPNTPVEWVIGTSYRDIYIKALGEVPPYTGTTAEALIHSELQARYIEAIVKAPEVLQSLHEKSADPQSLKSALQELLNVSFDIVIEK